MKIKKLVLFPPHSFALLQTRNTSMAFCREGGTWQMVHYGGRIGRAADADALSFSASWLGENALGWRKPASYSVFGSGTSTGTSSMNKFGGLAVTHADGATTTELAAGDAEAVPDVPGVAHFVLRMRDTSHPVYVVQHFRAALDCDVIETWVEIRHEEPGPILLGRMASLALTFPLVADSLRLTSLTGQWGNENRISETPIARGQTVVLNARSGVRAAWGANPAFMLSLDGPASETAGRVLGGVLAWSGAWSISVEHDYMDTLEIVAGAEIPGGSYVLEPGRTLVTPKMALTYSADGQGRVSRNFHRWAREFHMRDGNRPRPVVLNSAEVLGCSPDEAKLVGLMDGARDLGLELVVLDDFWFGSGKYARDDEDRGLGDWVVNPKKFPRGLAHLAAEAKARSLEFGLWVEPEMANTKSVLAEAYPGWILRERGQPLRTGRGGSQVVLDLTNPAVRDNLYGQLRNIYDAIPGLAYVKWDANADFMNLGSSFLPADRQANLWFDYTEGLYDLLGRLGARYPNLMVQACASGGGRMDYGFLRHADEFWPSDDTDARQRVFIQWGAGLFYPACALAAHVTAVPCHQSNRTTPFKFRTDVAMSGRLGLELDPSSMMPDEKKFFRRAVADYKRLRPVIQQGDLHRLVSPLTHSYAALMFVSEDRAVAVVFLYGLVRDVQCDYPPPLLLRGLDPVRRYNVTELNRTDFGHVRADGRTLEGTALMSMGLPVRFRRGDYDSAVIELRAESN